MIFFHFFFLNNRFESHLERLFFLLHFNCSNLVCFSILKFHLSPQHPTSSCRPEMASVRPRARQGKPPAGFCSDADGQCYQPKGLMSWRTETKTPHPIFTAIQWCLVRGGYSEVGHGAKHLRQTQSRGQWDQLRRRSPQGLSFSSRAGLWPHSSPCAWSQVMVTIFTVRKRPSTAQDVSDW